MYFIRTIDSLTIYVNKYFSNLFIKGMYNIVLYYYSNTFSTSGLTVLVKN